MIKFVKEHFWAWRTMRALRRISRDYGLDKARIYAPGHTEDVGARVRAIVLFDDEELLAQWAAWGCKGIAPDEIHRTAE